MNSKDPENIDDRIKDLLEIQERSIVDIFNNIEKIVKEHSRTRGGRQYILGTNFRLDLRSLRYKIVTEFQKMKKK